MSIADREIGHSHPKKHHSVPDSYLLIAVQQLRFNPVAIDIGAVATPSIDDQKPAVRLYKYSVKFAHTLAANSDAIRSVPSDRVLQIF